VFTVPAAYGFGAGHAPLVLLGWCAAALAFGGLVVLSTRVLVRRTLWARRLHLTLRAALLGLPPSRIALLALLSAGAEELLFRAAMVPSVGVWVSAVIFGLLHVAPGAGFAWSLWATVMGVCFGALFLASGSLWPPLLAHALINYENMHYICNYDPLPLHMDRLPPQGSRREVV
jgi:membrane protease YdiL (CAAX protease family)